MPISLPPLKKPRYLPWPERFWQNVLAEPNSGCWLWMGSVGGHGYGQIAKDGGPKTAHRLSWEMQFGPVPPDKWVLHRCDTRSCVNPAHMFLGTAADNNWDKVSKGRSNSVRGERCGRAKLTEKDVRTIKNLKWLNSSEISRLYGVAPNSVSLIRRGKSWKHV